MYLNNNTVFYKCHHNINIIANIIFRDDKIVSPKVNEVTVASADTFPLKKDEKVVKSTLKPITEEKKTSIQKVTETISSKKSTDNNKKVKRDKRDESSDSDESDDGMYIMINKILLNNFNIKLIFPGNIINGF